MRVNYYIHIKLHFLYFQLTITTCIMYQHNYNNILCLKPALCTTIVVVKMDSIQSNQYTYFWVDFN